MGNPADALAISGAVTPLDRLLFGALAALLAVGIAATWIVQPGYASTLPEYLFKFLPALSDGGLRAIFDTVGIGDPRPRVLSNLLTLANVSVRQSAILGDWFHPGASVNWLLYPASLLLLYRAVCIIGANRRVAAACTLLYAASPALLDTLTNYYVPAKPLTNFFIVLALYGGALVFPAPEGAKRPRPALGATLMAIAITCGLLSDETIVFAYLLLAALFGPRLIAGSRPGRLAFATGLLVPAGLFCMLFSIVLPAINRLLEQVPLDYFGVVRKGVYSAIFEIPADPRLRIAAEFLPFNLLETIVSAHAVPLRYVPGSWTSLEAWHFHHWPLPDQVYLLMFVVITLYFWVGLGPAYKSVVLRLVASALLFIAAQTYAMRPLAPVLLEVNYYAAPASIWIALIFGHIVGPSTSSGSLAAGRFLFLCYLILVQITNYEATSRRHPYWSVPEPSWRELQLLRTRVMNGEMAQIAQQIWYEDRRFMWAFEMEVARRASRREPVDLSPRQPAARSALSLVLRRAYEDDLIRNGDTLPALPEPSVSRIAGVRRVGHDELANTLRSRTIRGQSSDWRYIRRVGADGEFGERIWLGGLMRQWYLGGRLERRPGQSCAVFPASPSECVDRIYLAPDGTYFGFALNGELVTRFRVEPPR